MKFTLAGEVMHDALSMVGGTIPRKTHHDVMLNVRLQVDQDHLVLAGTDGVTHVVHDAGAQVDTDEEGVILLNFHILQALVKELQACDMIEFHLVDGRMELRVDHAWFALVTADPADFPKLPVFPKAAHAVIPGDTLEGLVKRTAFSAAAEETRYAIHGVLLEVGPSLVRMVATDGKRLAVSSDPIDTVPRGPKGGKVSKSKKTRTAILSPRALAQITRAWNDDSKVVELSFTERSVLARCGGTLVSTQMIVGTFPEWQAVIPAETAINMTVRREDLLDAVRRATIVSGEGSYGIQLRPGLSCIKVECRGHAAGEGELTIGAEGDPGSNPPTFHLQPRNLRQLLQASVDEKIDIGMNPPITVSPETSVPYDHPIPQPVVFKDGDLSTYVVMPITPEPELIKRGTPEEDE